MIVLDLLNYDVPYLRPNDTVGEALDIMHDAHQTELPLVDQDFFVFLASEDYLSNFDDNTVMADVPPSGSVTQLNERLNILQLPSVFLQTETTMLPVTDTDGKYKGLVLNSDVNQQLVHSLFTENVGLVSIILNNKDYSLATISRIAETENVKIMKAFVTGSGIEGEKDLQVLLQFNTNEIQGALSSLRRFGYNAENLTPGNEIVSIDRDRYEMLMKYLEI